jgi:hypothetical protein
LKQIDEIMEDFVIDEEDLIDSDEEFDQKEKKLVSEIHEIAKSIQAS